MTFKRVFMIMCLFVCLYAMASVCASDAATASEDTGLELSADNEMDEVNLQTNEKNPTLAVGDDDETASGQTSSQTLTDGKYSYSYLRQQIGSGGNKNLTKGTYTYNKNDGDTIQITDSGVIDGNGAIIDMAGSSIRAFEVTRSGVTIKNLTIKNANFDDNGGAVYFNGSGTVINCNFANNAVNPQKLYGGAVFFYGNGTVTGCNFKNNTAGYGGGVYFNENGIVTNSNFTQCSAGDGGAIRINSGTVSNCNFINNIAIWVGGAVLMYYGSIEKCNFMANKAIDDFSSGGAVFFSYTPDPQNPVYDACTLKNCNFADNYAWEGGAVSIKSGIVENCNFTENKATGDNAWGGAVYFSQIGTVKNCNFTDNSAYNEGGAIVMDSGNVENCDFSGNNAYTGSAIYFCNYGIWERTYVSDPLSGESYWDYFLAYHSSNVSNSRFINNRANAEDLQITKNDSNITITFTGKNGLLNAIYSRSDVEVTFTDVTYWGANGIANTGSSTISPSMSNRAAGQNITIVIIVNDVLVLNDVKLTDENGMIVLNISAGENYFIGARHNADSYYTEAEQTLSKNTKFNVNVTSQKTNSKTVNITAKSNIYNEFMPGKVLFVLKNTENITANYAGNGTWWALHTFDDYASYEVTAKYSESDNMEINGATITITKANSTLTVGDIAFDYKGSGTALVSFTGATGVNANVIGKPNAKVKVVGNTITVSGLNPGTYTLNVTAIADDDHNSVTKTATITVNKLKTKLVASAVTATYNINKILVITLSDAKGNPLSDVKITVDIKGAKFTTDKKGKVKVNVAKLVPKTYYAKITFNGNDNYIKSTKSVKVTVKKATPKITAKAKTFKLKDKTKKYAVKLNINQKVKVAIKVNKRTYYAYTTTKGVATFKLNKLAKKGKHTATVSFAGNKCYNKAKSVNVKINVK